MTRARNKKKDKQEPNKQEPQVNPHSQLIVQQRQSAPSKKRTKKKKWVEPDPTGGIPDAWLPPSYWN